MRAIYYAESLIDARLLIDRLDAKGIRTFLHNEHLQGALGELPMTLRPVVALINEHDFGQARDEVIEFEAARRSPEAPERDCAECGESSPSNFQLCWSCRAQLTEPE